MQEIKVRLTFTEEILGTASADKEIHKTYIASLAPDAPSKKEEVEAIGVEETIEKAMTVFPRNKEGVPIYWDYQIKGFFKDAAGMLRGRYLWDWLDEKGNVIGGNYRAKEKHGRDEKGEVCG